MTSAAGLARHFAGKPHLRRPARYLQLRNLVMPVLSNLG